jgi:hypothetical protein
VFANTLTRKTHQEADYMYAANTIYSKVLGGDYDTPVGPLPPAITTTSLVGGTVGTPYTAKLAATSASVVTWSISAGNLPNGLNLNAATGDITGTPTASGTFTFTVKAANTFGEDTKQLSIVVAAASATETPRGNWSSQGPNFRPGPTAGSAPGTTVPDPETPLSPPVAEFKYPLIKPSLPLGSTVTGGKTNNKLVIGEKEQTFPAVNIQGYNFIKLRDLAMILNGTGKQFSVGYNNATRTVTLTSGGTYAPLGDELRDNLADPVSSFVSSQRILLDGKLVEVLAYNINDYNYLRLRDLAIMFDFNIDFVEDTGVITLKLEEQYEE